MIERIIEKAPKEENNSSTVRVYRLREQVDLIDDSIAPILIPNTQHIGQFACTAVRKNNFIVFNTLHTDSPSEVANSRHCA